MLGDSKAGGPEDAKWSYETGCGPYRILEDVKAGGPEEAKWSYEFGSGAS